jgi:predicted RNA-binding protein with PIN domain
MQLFSPKPQTPKLQVRDLLRAEIRSAKPRFWGRFRKASLPRLSEAVEAAAVLVAVVGFGLGCALWLEPSGPEMQGVQPVWPASLSGTAYPGPAMSTPDSSDEAPGSHSPANTADPHVDEWLVDGFNLLHAVLLGGEDRSQWWKASGRSRVLEAVAEATSEDEHDRVWVVFDGSRPAPESSSDAGNVDRLQSVFAPSADDWLVRRVKAAPDPAHVVVVTGDRKLANRARHNGAVIQSPSDFLSRKA